MSGNGSDFESDGDFLQEPSAKKSKLEDAVEEHGEVLQLHTDWDHRDAAVRHSAYTTDADDGPVPVPQSDFEIEINSSNQDGPTSPGHEITLTSTSVSMQMEPRILTIDARLHDAATTSIVTSDHTTEQHTLLPSSPDDVNSDQSPSSIRHDFTSLIAAAGRSGLIPVSDHITASDLANNQFILQSQSRVSTDGSQSSGPLYVMIPPSSNGADLLQAAMQHSPIQTNQRPIVPRLASGAIIEPSDDNRKHKEYIRKQTHNEVERRRRDRINELIKMLAEIVPGCQKKDASNGNIVGYVYSKGTVLEKTVEYVRELLTQNDQLSATAKLAEKSAGALQVLQNQIAVLEKENSFLRAQMIQLGIDTSSNALNTRSLLTNSLTQSLLNTPHVVTPHVVTPPPVPNTTQLLMNLAQTLTSNPLLASLNHQQTIQQPASEAQHQTTVPPVTPITTSAAGSSSSSNHHNSVSNLVVNSLVQTLANITNGSPSTPHTPPPPPSQSSAATAAMNLLNSLIMAQSAVNASTTTTPSATPSSDTPTPVNLLLSQNSLEKTST